MDESAQQAVQIGVNVTIFIVALSLGISLMLGIRDVAAVATDYDASIPSGSRVVSVSEEKDRTIKGYELFSYYSNYISDDKLGKSYKYVITIVNADNQIVAKTKEDSDYINYQLNRNSNGPTQTLYSFFSSLDLKKEYEIICDTYIESEEKLYITIKERWE